MKKMKMMMLLSCLILAITASGVMSVGAQTPVGEPSLSVKTYTPDKFDFVDYYGTVGDVQTGGATTFAHAGMTIPLKGDAISMDTQFMLLPHSPEFAGGDGSFDGWATYSFSATPADITSDKTFPYYGGTTPGIFLHVQNLKAGDLVATLLRLVEFDGTSDSNLFEEIEIGLVLSEKQVNLSLTKQEDGKYTFLYTDLSGEEELFRKDEIEINVPFANDAGQTFFSTALYENDDCDGNHWEHRGVAVFSADVYTYDATTAQVTLSQSEYVFDEATTSYKPTVVVKVGTAELVQDADYYLEYANFSGIGTATVEVNFIGAYAGNAKATKSYTIAESTSPGDTDEPGDTTDPGNNDNTEKDNNLTLIIILSSIAAVLVLAGVGTVIFIKRKNK